MSHPWLLKFQWAILAGAIWIPQARPQALLMAPPGKAKATFEVASVKWIDRDKMQGNHEGHELNAERFVDRTELIQFISMAYFRGNVCSLKTVLGVKNDRYEIQAKIPANTVPRQCP